MARDLLENYPIRYIDLTNKVSISNARCGEFATVVAKVHEVTENDHKRLTLFDGSGALLLDFFYDCEVANSVRQGDLVAAAGYVVDIGGFKTMTNPLLETGFDESREVLAIYRDRSQAPLIKDSMSDASETMRAIHGLTTKRALISARESIKRKQVREFIERSAESDPVKYLLGVYGFQLSAMSSSCIEIYHRDQFGDVCEEVREASAKGNNIYVACPLACLTTNERNDLCTSYFENCNFLEREYHPNVSIEGCRGDVFNNYRGVMKRKAIYEAAIGGAYSNLFVFDDQMRIDWSGAREESLLIVEDCDRLSTLFIDSLRRRIAGRCILISNSNNARQISRLESLKKFDNREDILASELQMRRDGDILGNRAPHTEILSLVNPIRDRELF